MSPGSADRSPPQPGRASLLADVTTLTGALEALAREAPDTEALTILRAGDGEQQVTGGEIWSAARAFQGRFQSAGVDAGNVVVIALETGLELFAAFFGALLAGGVPALIAPPSNRIADPRIYSRRTTRILRNAKAAAFVCDAQLADSFGRDRTLRADGVALLTPDALTESPAAPPHRANPEEIATVQYSSGSTADPKGVLLSHRAVIESVRSWLDCFQIGPEDVTVNWLPLYHDMGLISTFLLPLLQRSRAVLIPTPDFSRQPELWLKGIDRHRASVSFSPNFGYSVCARRLGDAAIEGLDLSCWRVAVSGAEPILAPTCRAFHSRFERYGLRPTALTSVYGMAEYVTIVAGEDPHAELVVDRVDAEEFRRGEARPARDGDPAALEFVSVGRAARGTEVDVRDESGASLPDRGVGEICFRGAALFEGYIGEPRHDPEAWFPSGDLGYRVGERFFFVSRKKDLVVVGGENHSPHEIELLVDEIDGVRSGCVVVFGVLSEARGTEDLAMVVETKESAPEVLDRIRRDIRSAVLSGTGLGLKHLLLVPPGGVEKTTSGKLARGATRDRYRGELGLSV